MKNLSYPPADPPREQYLKVTFADMSPSSLADYSREHPGDLNLQEYMIRYATPQVNQTVLTILDSLDDHPLNSPEKPRRIHRRTRIKL